VTEQISATKDQWQLDIREDHAGKKKEGRKQGKNDEA